MLCCPDSVGKLLLNMLCLQTGALINAAVLSMSSPLLRVPQPCAVLAPRPEMHCIHLQNLSTSSFPFIFP